MDKLNKCNVPFYINEAIKAKSVSLNDGVDLSLHVTREMMKHDAHIPLSDSSSIYTLKIGDKNEPLLVCGDDPFSRYAFVKNIIEGYSTHHKMLVLSQKPFNEFSTIQSSILSLDSYSDLIDGIHRFLDGHIKCLELDMSDYTITSKNDERVSFSIESLLVGLKTNLKESCFLIVDSSCIDDTLYKCLTSLLRNMKDHQLKIIVYGSGDSLERFITTPIKQDIFLTKNNSETTLPHSLRMKLDGTDDLDLSQLEENELVYIRNDEMKILKYLKWEENTYVK